MYNNGITRHNPSCFLFLVDQSSSMAQPFGEDRVAAQTKAEGVALALNNLIRNLVITCSKAEGVRNYFDIAVIGYGKTIGSAWTGALAGGEIVPIRDVAYNFARMAERTPAASGVPVQTARVPVWVEPSAGGSTPMCEALHYSYGLLSNWLRTNNSAFPPVVVHITDGEATDGDPAPLMASLTDLKTANGSVTLFNVHLSSRWGAVPASFPDTPAALVDATGKPDPFARMLWERASVLTPFMRSVAWDNGIYLTPESKAFVLNADPTLMVLALEIGTRPGNIW